MALISPGRPGHGARRTYPPSADLPGLLRLLDPLLKVMEHVQHRLDLAPGAQAEAQNHALRGDPASRGEGAGRGQSGSPPFTSMHAHANKFTRTHVPAHMQACTAHVYTHARTDMQSDFQQPGCTHMHASTCGSVYMHGTQCMTHPSTHTCMHLHTYTYTHTAARMHLHTYTHAGMHTQTCRHACTHMHTPTHKHVHTCRHSHIHACTRAQAHTCTCACMYTHIYTHSWAHICMCAHRHAHTGTHMHAHALSPEGPEGPGRRRGLRGTLTSRSKSLP